MAAVGAALKRILLSLATSKKGRKILLYIVLVVLFLLFFPILAVVAVLNSDVSYDRTQLVQLVSQNLSAEDRAKLQQINDTGIAIDNAMNEAGFNTRAKEAEVLFLLALSVETLCTELFAKRLVAKTCGWWVSYDYKSLEHCPGYDGPISIDFYGRLHPKHCNGTVKLPTMTNSIQIITEVMLKQFDEKTDHRLLYRRLGVCANDVAPDDAACQINMFLDYDKLDHENRLRGAMQLVRQKYGANALFRGMNLMEGATALERNQQIGGHRR